ncbi:nicotinate-nucleotide pyrophosphorylase [carboxylating]-like [Ruditapes philippinarum]|uniref:nicotinate-nucleotide pyrophosphorylase [carboxylating]-like n=1 Tax=Ruditapes philippinarum TaxID=129788 RepID=UPI00295A69B8|nr:nicotinate-nucleotide pyrophosphorylase [carboxylating]-like [Ruditapes philippinarum]
MTSNKDDLVLNGIHNPNISHVLHPLTIRHLAREWLKEDTPNFDYGGFVVGEKEETAVLLMKSAGVLAGRPFFDAIFKELDCTVMWENVLEGSFNEPIKTVATVSGKVRQILLGERVALNIITRASGIASAAHRLRKMVQKLGWTGQVAGTRKTTPGFRLVEKYALLVGGVSTHRYDLSSMIMLKDNHIWTAGSITQAVKDAHVVGGFSTKIEVECRSIEDAEEAASAGCDVIMLDNFSPEAIPKAAAMLKEKFPKLIVEVSGGITEDNIAQYCDKNVDIISLSRLTQGYDTLDFSLKVRKEGIDPRNLPVKL